MVRTALILGASGGVGGATARALARREWRIRALTRTPRDGAGFDWIVGDAMDRAAVHAAAEGVDAIVHAVNPPGYRDWDRLVLPMLDNSIAAARAEGARLALPGTIYNYDPARQPLLRPDTPQQPVTRKGAIRVEMERRIVEACERDMRALILRGGDFFGPRSGNSWFSQGLVTPGRPVKSLLYPGKRGVGHAWAYLPDVGETFARLLDSEEKLPGFARYHFAGHWDENGTAMIDAIARAAGRPDLRVRKFPWRLLPIIGLFNPTLRELAEMRDFWRYPAALDNRELVAMLGEEPHTPLVTAVADSLSALGCIDPRC